MAWQINDIVPEARYRGVNYTDYRYKRPEHSGTESVQISGTITADAAKDEAKKKANEKINTYTSRAYANQMLKIESYTYEDNGWEITRDVQKVSEIEEVDKRCKNVGDFYTVAVDSQQLGVPFVSGRTASCSWSVVGIGARRTSYTQCFGFKIGDPSAFDNGEITINVTNSTKYSFPVYLTAATEASFIDDYKAQPYVNFTIPSNVSNSPVVVPLSNVANLIKGFGEAATIFFVIGSTREAVNSNISIDSASLSYSLSYVKCPALTDFSIESSIIKPGGICKLTWTPRLLTGYANNVSGYEISWTNIRGSVVNSSASSIKINETYIITIENGTSVTKDWEDVVRIDDSSIKIDKAEVKSLEISVVEGDESRGNSCLFTIKAKSSVDGYDSDPISAEKTCTINSLPVVNFKDGTGITVPSSTKTNASYTITGTVIDVDGQTLQYKRGGEIPPSDKEVLKPIKEDRSFSEEVTISGTEGEAGEATYYFHFWDGVEWLTKSFTIKRNKKPGYGENTSFALGGLLYSKKGFNTGTEPKQKEYLPIFSTEMKKYEDKTAEMRYFQIWTGDADGSVSSFKDSGLKITSSGELSNYSMVLEKLPKETYSYMVKAYYNDGIEDSDEITSETYYVAQWPTITGIYNSYDKKDVGSENEERAGTETVVENRKDFFKNFSIDFGDYDSFYFKNSTGGYDEGAAKIVIEPTSYVSADFQYEFKAKDNEVYCSYFNGSYEGVPYDSIVKITVYAEFQNGNQTVRHEIGSGSLHRIENPINTSYLSTWQQRPLTANPYTTTDGFSCTLPYNKIGSSDKLSGSLEFFNEKGESEDVPIYYNYKKGAIPSVGSVSTEFTWGEQEDPVPANKRAYNSPQEVPVTFTLENIFGEKFVVSNTMVLEYREKVEVKLETPQICCGKGETDTNGWLNINNNTILREGQLIRIPYTVITYNSWNLTAILTSKIAGESATDTIGSIVQTKLPNPTQSGLHYIYFLLGEQTGASVSKAFTVTVVPKGQDSDIFNGVAYTQMDITTERLVPSKFEIEDSGYNDATETGEFSFKLNFSDYGGSGASTTSKFKSVEEKSYFSLYSEGDNTALSTKFIDFNKHELTTGANGEITPVSYDLTFSSKFPETKSFDYFTISTTFVVDYDKIDDYQPSHCVKNDSGKYVISTSNPNSISKTTYSRRILIYNIVPTVRYGKNRLGVNVNGFSDGEALVELAQYNDRKKIAAIGNSLYIVNFIIDGGDVGSWSQQEN